MDQGWGELCQSLCRVFLGGTWSETDVCHLFFVRAFFSGCLGLFMGHRCQTANPRRLPGRPGPSMTHHCFPPGSGRWLVAQVVVPILASKVSLLTEERLASLCEVPVETEVAQDERAYCALWMRGGLWMKVSEGDGCKGGSHWYYRLSYIYYIYIYILLVESDVCVYY